jgi:predicted acylesterase/phospholipase RssA
MKKTAGAHARDPLDSLPETRRDRSVAARDRTPDAGHDAFVLAGGVAKGAFTAGALAVLTAPGSGLSLSTRRIVAASSGSLSAAYLAASARAGTMATVGAELEELWLREATYDAFDVSVNGVVTLAGISTSKKLRELLARHIRPSQGNGRIDLRLVTTNTAGALGLIAGSPATTFEHVFRFDGSAFDGAEHLESLFTAVCASSAFPGAFLPVQATIGGRAVPCMDGGIVNNAPLKHAIGDDRDVSRVFVITPYPRVFDEVPELRGLALVTHLAEMLIHERLFRDLREAESVNEALVRLETALPHREQRAAALEAIGWTGRKQLEIVEIRPPAPLAGGAFDGLFSRELRAEYIQAGETAARAWLASAGFDRAA